MNSSMKHRAFWDVMLFIFKIVAGFLNEFAAFRFRIEEMALQIGVIGFYKI